MLKNKLKKRIFLIISSLLIILIIYLFPTKKIETINNEKKSYKDAYIYLIDYNNYVARVNVVLKENDRINKIKEIRHIFEEKVKNNDQSRIILFIDEIYEIIKNDISVKDDINYLLEVGATMNIHIIMSTDSVLDEDINYLFDKDDISKLSFYLTTRREYNKFLDNYIDESLGRNGIYVSTNSTLTRISLPLIEDDEITRVVDNLEVNI